MAGDLATDDPVSEGNAVSGDRAAAQKGATARDLLGPRSRVGPPWASFYPDWYLAMYPDAHAQLANASFGGVLNHYLDIGQRAAHSPNPFFDETWYRAAYPGVATAIAAGTVESGFDQYCRLGFSHRSPHWLFDELDYRARYPDLSDDVLAAHQLANGYGHYLRHGDREGRIGSLFFDPAIYRAHLADADIATDSSEGLFVTFLRLEMRPGSNPGPAEPCTTLYFDPIWYCRTYPEIAAAIAAGQYRNALHHYLTNATPTAFDPLPVFSERAYLATYQDIAGAVALGKCHRGYQHFLKEGAAELRAAGPLLDLKWYVANNPEVRADLAAGRARDAFTHYLTIGLPAGLAGAPPPARALHDNSSVTLYRVRASASLSATARRRLDFTCTGSPTLAIIMLVHGEFTLALQALAGLRDRTQGDIELILVDRGSRSYLQNFHCYIAGAKLLRFDGKVNLAAARNAALDAVSAPTVLLLGSDTDLAHGAIAAALDRLDSDRRIGAVGARLLGPDGRLRAAGGIVWRDGGLLDYMRDRPALSPEANFVRVVDFCSSVFLLTRTTVLQELGGFDIRFARADYADADLCVRIAAAGYRVMYDPNVVVHQLGLSGQAAAPGNDKDVFFRKHINQLRFRYPADPKVEIFARALTTEQRRVLFIDDLVPIRMIGSGFARANDLIKVLASMGVFVTMFPINRGIIDLAAIYADVPDTVEVMHDRAADDLVPLFRERQGYYDLIWVARTHNLDHILTGLEHITTGRGRPTRVVLDVEAIAAQREAMRHRLAGKDREFDLEAAILKEFTNVHHCQNIIVVNEQEASTLRTLGFSDVTVIGHIRELTPTSRPFVERSGLLFIGAIHEMNSPNYDGLVWFVDEVLPLIERQLGWETRLNIVGYTDPGVSLDRFRHHPRITLRGAISHTEPLYNANRVFIAPTRYAAGTPYKIYEAASYGLPVVATDLLREQTGWEHGKELLAADHGDPAQFAQHVVLLYRDAASWQALRDNALARLAADNSREHYVEALSHILVR
jgi:GT2 family glycosyltransferase